MVSTDPLRRFCRTDCWLNGLLLAVFGEEIGKVILGSMWIIGGLCFFYMATRLRNKREYRNDD